MIATIEIPVTQAVVMERISSTEQRVLFQLSLVGNFGISGDCITRCSEMPE
jgi:hypothetical protein